MVNADKNSDCGGVCSYLAFWQEKKCQGYNLGLETNEGFRFSVGTCMFFPQLGSLTDPLSMFQ